MACTGAYAAAWQFAAFFCSGALYSRVDDSGGAGNAMLTDSQQDFATSGIEANRGMILYNLTDGSSGPVTTVTLHTLTATLAGGTTDLWDDGDEYRIVTLDSQEIATIDHYLSIAASDLHAAMAANGMCDCNLAGWAEGFLQKLNIIDAASYYQCKCGQPRLTDDMRQSYLDWCSTQLELIRMGKLELCGGETGIEYPVVGWAQYSFTERNAAQLIVNRLLEIG